RSRRSRYTPPVSRLGRSASAPERGRGPLAARSGAARRTRGVRGAASGEGSRHGWYTPGCSSGASAGSAQAVVAPRAATAHRAGAGLPQPHSGGTMDLLITLVPLAAI